MLFHEVTWCEGTYKVSVSDASGCQQVFSYSITEPGLLTVSAGSVTQVSCFGGDDGALTVSVSGGTSPYSYLWNTDGTTSTLSNLTAGTYQVTVTDASSCTGSLIISITEPTALVATGGANNVTTCGASDGAIAISISGGTPDYTYAWDDNGPSGSLNSAPYAISRSNLGEGTYKVSVSDASGCQQVFSYSITEPGLLTVSAGSVTNASCFGGDDGALTVSVSGGTSPYSYLWNTDGTTSTLSGLTAGTYQVTVTDASSCTGSLIISITEPTALVATGGANNVTTCGASDGSIAISISGGTPDYTYAWDDNGPSGSLNSAPYAISRSNLGEGTYKVSVSDASGCQQVFSYSITEPGLLTVSAGSVTNASCFGGDDGALTVSVSGGTSPYSYIWNTDGTTSTLSGLTAGTYQVTVTDASSCTGSLIISITEPTALVATGGANNVTTCGASDGSIAISISGGTPDYTYAWDDNGPSGSLNSAPYAISRSNLGEGTYKVSVSDASGCQQVFSYSITEPGLLTVSAGSVTNASCFGGDDGALTVSVSGGTSPYSYIWNTAHTTYSPE